MTAQSRFSGARRPLTLRLVSMAAAGVLVAPSLVACGSDDDQQSDQTVYCVDANDNIVDDSLCDETSTSTGSGSHFLMFAAAGYLLGSRLPSGGTRISPTDKAARTAAGLSSTGRAAGTTVKSGGIGKGSTGSSGSSGSGS